MVEVLQTATTTAEKMLTAWLYPVWGGVNHLGYATLIIVALALGIAKFNGLPRKSPLNKTGFAVNTPNSAAIVTKINYFAAHH
jgi:hypothetical protein